MAVEPKRGCGFRKAGGLYMVTDGLGEPCERLPLPLDACPTCGAGVKQTRSYQWIRPALVFENPGIKPCAASSDAPSENRSYFHEHCHRCVVCTPGLLEANAEPKDQLGLLWVGGKYYPTAEDWSKEAAKLGVSKRIAAIPKGLKVGKSWVLVAHPEAILVKKEFPPGPGELLGKTEIAHKPGVFHAFVPQRVELVVTPSMEQEKWVKELVEKQGVTLVRVPEDDPDHVQAVGKKSARKMAMERVARKATAKATPERKERTA
jgi:hypothetical protein